MKRKVTYTVRIPIEFTFVTDNDKTVNELFDEIYNEALKRLDNGYFDLINDATITKKVPHFTKEEKQAQDKAWADFLAEIEGRKRV